MSSISYVYLAVLISVVTLLPLLTSANAGKKIIIQGLVVCNTSCKAGAQFPQYVAKGIVGAEVRVACSNGTYYMQVQTRSKPLDTSGSMVAEGSFSVEWPKSEESMFSTDICAVYVDYVPDYISPKCNLVFYPEQASKGYPMFNDMNFNDGRKYITGAAILYYPPYGTQCP